MAKIFSLRLVSVILLACMVFACAGCATVRHPVPLEMVGKTQVENMPEIRTMTGAMNVELQKNALKAFLDVDDKDYPIDSDGKRVYPILCISGGAANGAYGAGLLKGWSKEGSRPIFKAVTGISTGAFIAPMVFLGKDYDGMMEELYTTMSTKQVLKAKGPVRALFSSSLTSNAPLAKQLEKYITPDLIEKVAYENNRGRRLYVGTAYLDAQRLVVWDMGAIAARGDIELFRKVVLASAAIPVMFPPVIINVKGGDECYDEMHVDGGTLTQVFTLYKIFEGQEGLAREMGIDISKVKGNYYIIRNGYVEPTYKAVKADLGSIAGQSFDAMINAQGVGDTYRIYTFMKQRGNDYNLAYIPGDCRPPKSEEFDPEQMKKLFDRGYQDAIKGYKWHKTPPGLKVSGEEAAR